MVSPVTCPICSYREPRIPQVCDPDRSWIDRVLREIPEFCGELAALGYVQRDRRGPVKVTLPPGSEVEEHFDQVANVLPAGPISGAGKSPRVSGTLVRGVPIRLDLLGPPDTRPVVDLFGDQAGDPAVAAVLRGWVVTWWEDWRGPFAGEQLLRDRSITASAGWLRTRLGEACDRLESIREFADELGAIHLSLRRALGLTDPQPEHCQGVPCKRCDLKELYRQPGDDWIECDACGLLLSAWEYDFWVKLNSSSLCGERNGNDSEKWWCARPRHHDGECRPASVLADEAA